MHLDIFVENLEVQLSNTAITSGYSEIGTRNISQHTPQYTPLTGAEVQEDGENAITGHQEPTYANRFTPGGVAEDHDSSEVIVPENQVINDDKFQSTVQIRVTESTTASQAVVHKNVIVYENLLSKWPNYWKQWTTEQWTSRHYIYEWRTRKFAMNNWQVHNINPWKRGSFKVPSCPSVFFNYIFQEPGRDNSEKRQEIIEALICDVSLP